MNVEPNFANKAECGCGCGQFGTLRAKPWRDGVVCVRRGCDCPRCRGKRNRQRGDSKARRARKVLAIPGANSRHEENWSGALRIEVKAGGIVAPAFSAFLKAEQQSEAQRPVGDHRPFAAVFQPDGTSDGVLVCRLSAVHDVAAALLENLEKVG